MYSLLIIPVLVGFITQILKLAFDGIPKNLDWKHIFFSYGGMPSSHTAFVSSLATVIVLREGLNSAAFAVSLILMVLIIRDAAGLRMEIGRNAKLTNQLAREIYKGKTDKFTPLREQVGHTSVQIIAGFVIGVGLAALLYWLFIIF